MSLRKETVQLYKQISDLERALGSGQFDSERIRVSIISLKRIILL
jgi:hypothetical protein